MNEQFLAQVTLTTEVCCHCGVVFTMPSSLMHVHRTDGSSFYCPNGHAQHYTQTTEEKLKIAEAKIQQQENIIEAFRKRERRLEKNLINCKNLLENYVKSAGGA